MTLTSKLFETRGSEWSIRRTFRARRRIFHGLTGGDLNYYFSYAHACHHHSLGLDPSRGLAPESMVTRDLIHRVCEVSASTVSDPLTSRPVIIPYGAPS